MHKGKRSIGDLIRAAWSQGDPTGWFEEVYAQAAAGKSGIPWALNRPHPDLVSWLANNPVDGAGKRAILVGCGLGDDAEYLNKHGFDVTAFDVSNTAITQCKARFPNSRGNYVVADLFDLPQHWRKAFDFVLEIYTIQSLPHQFTMKATEAIASLVANAGTMLVICLGRDPEEDRHGIPWPLSRQELAGFTDSGLLEISFEDLVDSGRRFRVHYNKPY